MKVRLTTEELEKIKKIIYLKSGIWFDEKKNYFIESKIIERLRATGMTPQKYIEVLEKNITGELDKLINAVTIGETFFFRDKPQLDTFFGKVLKSRIQKTEITCISAGCATGEEAYTLAIYLLENFPLAKNRVWGIDINENFIARARQGIYDAWKIRYVPPHIREKYLRQKNSVWEVSPAVKSIVSFEVGNIIDPLYMRKFKNIDFIFCKNVLIYFDEKSKMKALENFWYCLATGGFLVLSPVERIPLTTEIFEPVFENGFFFWMKV